MKIILLYLNMKKMIINFLSLKKMNLTVLYNYISIFLKYLMRWRKEVRFA